MPSSSIRRCLRGSCGDRARSDVEDRHSLCRAYASDTHTWLAWAQYMSTILLRYTKTYILHMRSNIAWALHPPDCADIELRISKGLTVGMIGERPFSHTDLIVSTCELILSRARAPLANLEGLAIESCRHCRRFWAEVSSLAPIALAQASLEATEILCWCTWSPIIYQHAQI